MQHRFSADHRPLWNHHYCVDFPEVTRRWNAMSGEGISESRVKQIHDDAIHKLYEALREEEWHQ